MSVVPIAAPAVASSAANDTRVTPEPLAESAECVADASSGTKAAAAEYVDRSEVGRAYQRRLAEIEAVPDEALATVNLDPYAASTTVVGVLPKLACFREAMRAVPQLDHHLIDGLEDYALALVEAEGRYRTASRPPDEMPARYAEAMRLRDIVRMDTLALAKRGLIDPRRLWAFKGRVGYRSVAADLVRYAVLLSDVWPQIRGRTGMTEAELQSVKAVGEELTRAAGERMLARPIIAETAKTRRRALSLLLRSYDEVRRAITFLRWREGDAESIAPSLYAGRGKRPTPAGRSAEEPSTGAPVAESARP